ncbi:lipopolysaccharide assembly protein LapA domain-containing protein [Reyranella sp.]|jgi:uncharacterized integral membrane protein|uniref:lipopolysaccharide assembly protein LapA domain-containing protein n=1 Tax=Reyranella sp. TaxID=1929291 RepID=UPI003D0EADE2
MKYLSRAFFLLFLLVGVLIAVSNTEAVQLALWPLPHVVVLPLYLLVIALLLLGVLAGLVLGWWAGRRHRRRARERQDEVARLEREVASLRADLAAARPTPTPVQPAPREQRAIERQSALVAPEPFKQ